MMKSRLSRRALILASPALALGLPALAAPAPALSAADQALVAKATTYLEGLKSAKGRFVQTDARGVSLQGTLYLQRPGKARLEYDQPANRFWVSDGNQVSLVNGSLQTQQIFPLSTTPLALLLGRTIRFDRAARVSAVRPLAGGGFSITATEASGKTPGSITLNFSAAPALLGWSITDTSGTVRVRLLDLTPGPQPASLFVITDPRPTGARGR